MQNMVQDTARVGPGMLEVDELEEMFVDLLSLEYRGEEETKLLIRVNYS